MANPVDLEKLCQGAKVWNAWREENPDVVPDLTDAELTLSQRQFGPASGGPINLRGANLGGAALRYATLSGADLEDAILVGADLVHARLDGANLSGADLTDAVCDNADLAEARLDDALLTGTSFANARNLTEDQIAFANGDASTLLPATVQPPSTWFPPTDDSIYPEYAAPEQMADEDLYEVLGVASTANPEAIRTAFRALVKKFHPDLNPGNDQAQETFKKVSTAYRILSDPEKRVRYDKGEIGGDGEINPEFEAKRQFRRHAFRFYTAAALSLLLAGGVLGVFWYAVLTDDGVGRGRVEIAVATPPKSSERLDAPESELKVDFRRQPKLEIAENTEDAVEAKTEILAQPSGDEAKTEIPAQPSGDEPSKAEGEAVEPEATRNAEGGVAKTEPTMVAEAAGKNSPEHAALPAENAAPERQATLIEPNSGGGASGPAPSPAVSPEAKTADEQSTAPASASPPPAAESPPPDEAKVTTRPLFEEHKGEQARPAQADAAPAVTPSAQASPTPAPVVAGVPYANRTQPARNEAFMHKPEGRKIARNAISALFRYRAVKQTMAHDQQQATGSMDPLASREEYDAQQEEVWDVYTHSIPDAGAAPATAWPQFPQDKRVITRQVVRHVPREIIAKVPVRETAPAAASRKQAVSDILAGGL